MKHNAEKIKWLSRAKGIDRELEALNAAKFPPEKLYQQTRKLESIRTQTTKAISRVPNSIQRTILLDRYILNMTWEQIAEEINYSVRQTQRLHGLALQAFKCPQKDVTKCHT